LVEIFDNVKFDSPISERIIKKRIKKFKDQGFKSFEGVDGHDKLSQKWSLETEPLGE
jgi:hypothetical protein